jgi:hypothetical protein
LEGGCCCLGFVQGDPSLTSISATSKVGSSSGATNSVGGLSGAVHSGKGLPGAQTHTQTPTAESRIVSYGNVAKDKHASFHRNMKSNLLYKTRITIDGEQGAVPHDMTSLHQSNCGVPHGNNFGVDTRWLAESVSG